jgi:hypothetical protein
MLKNTSNSGAGKAPEEGENHMYIVSLISEHTTMKNISEEIHDAFNAFDTFEVFLRLDSNRILRKDLRIGYAKLYLIDEGTVILRTEYSAAYGTLPMRISLDNGATEATLEEACCNKMWPIVENALDPTICEKCNEEGWTERKDFLQRYLEISPVDLIIG